MILLFIGIILIWDSFSMEFMYYGISIINEPNEVPDWWQNQKKSDFFSLKQALYITRLEKLNMYHIPLYFYMESLFLSFSNLPFYLVCLWTCMCWCLCLPLFVYVCVYVRVQEYLTGLQALLRSVSETDFKLNSPEYWPAAYYNLPQQEHCLKVSNALVFLLVKYHTCGKTIGLFSSFICRISSPKHFKNIYYIYFSFFAVTRKCSVSYKSLFTLQHVFHVIMTYLSFFSLII